MLYIFDLDGTLAALDSTNLLPGVAEWFDASPGVPCAIATNQGGVGLRYWMETKDFGEPGKYPTQAQVERYEVMGDLCMGQGLVGLSAWDAGKPFVGTELNKRRLANLLQKLAKRGAVIRKKHRKELP